MVTRDLAGAAMLITDIKNTDAVSRTTVGAGYALGLLNLAVAKGANRAQLLARAGIGADDLEDQDNRIPMGNYVALMRSGQELAAEPALALLYGEAMDLSELSVVGLIARASDTMTEALAQLNRYGRLVVEVEGIGFVHAAALTLTPATTATVLPSDSTAVTPSLARRTSVTVPDVLPSAEVMLRPINASAWASADDCRI